MRGHRRRKRKKDRRQHWKLLSGVFLVMICVGVFVCRYTFPKEEAQDDGKGQQMAENENMDAENREKESSNLPEQGHLESQEPEGEVEPPEPEPTEEELLEQEIETFLEGMTVEEKICQMFILTPEQLTGVATVTAAGETTKSWLKQYPVGGLIYFAANLVSEEQTKEMLAHTLEFGKEIEGLPLFLCVDEEGGRVARIGGNPAFQVERIGPMGEITSEEEAYQAGAVIGKYLKELGFNVDFAPDADVITNEKNTVIGDRSFGSDPQTVTSLAAAVSNGLHSEGVLSTFKHFPGHGATEADTHQGYAYAKRTYEELMASELAPFAAAGENGVDMVMAAHISLPDLLGDDTPCSLSYQMITEILRNDLGYDGLVITDSLHMGAIAENYGSDEAAVKAVEAGVDLLLMPKDFPLACEGIQNAVTDGRISEERINESLRRILRKKLESLEK